MTRFLTQFFDWILLLKTTLGDVRKNKMFQIFVSFIFANDAGWYLNFWILFPLFTNIGKVKKY